MNYQLVSVSLLLGALLTELLLKASKYQLLSFNQLKKIFNTKPIQIKNQTIEKQINIEINQPKDQKAKSIEISKISKPSKTKFILKQDKKSPKQMYKTWFLSNKAKLNKSKRGQVSDLLYDDQQISDYNKPKQLKQAQKQLSSQKQQINDYNVFEYNHDSIHIDQLSESEQLEDYDENTIKQ